MTFDTSCDISNCEQLAIAFKFIDENFEVKERFFKMIELKKKDSATIYTVIHNFLCKESKIMDKVIAITTDGEKSVSSKKNGVIGKFLNNYPYIFYNHCICY